MARTRYSTMLRTAIRGYTQDVNNLEKELKRFEADPARAEDVREKLRKADAELARLVGELETYEREHPARMKRPLT